MKPAAVLALITAAAASCGDRNVPDDVDVAVDAFPSPAGYWEGKGTVRETPLADSARALTRNADFEFWFSLDPEGSALGEITVTYDSVLTVRGLPMLSVPGPSGISATFKPEVGGRITDPDPTRTFPLVGVLGADSLVLRLVRPDEPEPIEFTISADPGVSAGFAVGGAGARVDGRDTGAMVYPIEMTPFSPFADTDVARVEKRPGGPYAAHFALSGDNDLKVEWVAVQKSSATRTVEISDEMRDELDAIGQALR
jgi:hypothetical protein